MNIRAVKIEDAADINRMRTMNGVRENILGITSERVTDTETFIRNLSHSDHMLAAEIGGSVVGCVSLTVSKMPRERQTAGLGLMVHTDRQRQGIGRALMTAILDLADNWLMLKRVEVSVFVDNEPAVALYRSMGFVVEGTKKFASIRNGAYMDEYLMARYRI
ncbi:MAG: GNAT family N-acetyltransferase [Synergistaceae bacterium]|jgi:putative acetyltransferase|nr:GNAT family N-acetyltransferase [Synergistaceae bacterium]